MDHLQQRPRPEDMNGTDMVTTGTVLKPTVTPQRAFHSYVVANTRFTVPVEYELIRPIGQGAYGLVVSARNQRTGAHVAVKRISRVFAHATDARRTLREIKLLRHLRHENIIDLQDLFVEPSATQNEFDDVYLVSTLLDTDLHQIIASGQPLKDDHFQYFLYQILRGLKYIHSAKVLHRDLKPSNLLVRANCDLVIADFGLARAADPSSDTPEQQAFLTEYVATRWYRAPEIMLSWRHYTSAVDIWSVGCIFAELLGRRPLFPGRDYIHQLQLITSVLGTPSDRELDGIASDRAKRFMHSLPRRNRTPLEQLFPHCENPLALDLLSRMLCFRPEERISVETALAHPYLEKCADINDEPVCERAFDFSFEQRADRGGVAEIRRMLWDAIQER
ncbi:hypothetical protein CDCA_CDCA06G1905 [Cyanidium caldarium]|uniref:Mitogen-activated protein kinase n=1 Tax=Cyanidium caldarium TaxID=2771 RepID=A0AAV9IUB2_CYACA|nr:hypothetical protein CDCA_CDCA06G1905 [Cyanidium caldarium]